MGAWFFTRLKQTGLNVIGIDKASQEELGKFAESCDVALLAVPLNAFSEVSSIVGPRIRPDGLLIDIASLKSGPLRAMTQNSVCDVVGAHPMYGPSAESLNGQLIYICPARASNWMPRVCEFLENQGAQVCVMSAEKHDRLMATVQALRHILLTAIGLTLEETGFHFQKDAPISGQWFQQITEMIERQFQQPPELYADLALANEHAREILDCFKSKNEALMNCVLTGNKDALVELMRHAGSYAKSHKG